MSAEVFAKIRREVGLYGVWVIVVLGANLLLVVALLALAGWPAARLTSGWGLSILAIRGYVAINRIDRWTKR